MGHTTTFAGRFALSPKLTLDQYMTLKRLGDDEQSVGPCGHCQWQPTDDGLGLEWDRNEKFYDYVEWLQYIIDDLLKPWGVTCSGAVSYEGEDKSDFGKLVIRDGVVKVIKGKRVIKETFEEEP